jgi:hypothetical protein
MIDSEDEESIVFLPRVSKKDDLHLEANAQLISAAPELLDALKTAYGLLKPKYLLSPQHIGEMNAINSAIAKAEK